MSVKWTVLVGMNGAGKSSLLSKMKSGEAVEGVELGENTIFIENLGGGSLRRGP
jgi:ABC-type cobalamin/Fe3+-siderophores transport system ATPase subunit